MSNKVTVVDMLKILQSTKTYNGLSKHYIDKMLKDKYKLNTVKKDDYAREITLIQTNQPKFSQPNLAYIASLNIDYLSTLDYVDLKNLCKTDKQTNQHVCKNNDLLKQILIKSTKNNIQLLPNLNLSQILNDLYTHIVNLVSETWPIDKQYPKWVNAELLFDSMIRRVYLQIHEFIYNSYEDNNLKKLQGLKSINIDQALLTFPLVPVVEVIADYGLKNHKSVLDTENELILPNHFYDYINYTLQHLENVKDKYKIIKKLLFIRKYTFSEVWMGM
ncbi:MAG TPA: hypothetical protein VLG50_08135 [Candidatus Saccharimonadales bacterium]|nr:hypothetical protein [Candidatus Saccharimonadales bacterium]